jgi:hypothetical protein
MKRYFNLSFHSALITLLLAGLLGLSLRTQAQPSLSWERIHPKRYESGGWSFELPGHRFVHAGSTYIAQGSYPLARQELMLSVTTALGDTVRYQRLNRLPLWGYDEVTGVVLEADYSVTCFSIRYSGMLAFPHQFVLTNLDTLGQVRWTRAYPAYPIQTGSLLRVGDGYLMLTNADVPVGSGSVIKGAMLKVDEQGLVQWQRTYDSRGYVGEGSLLDIVACPDGSYLATGYCDDNPVYTGGSAHRRQDYWMVKLAPNGDTLATTHFGAPNVFDAGLRVRLTPDGGAIVAGFKDNSAQIKAPELIKLDAQFRPEWTHTETPLIGNDHRYFFMQPLQSGGIVAGGMVTVGSAYQSQVQRFTSAGALEWEARRLASPWPYTGFTTMVSQADGSAYFKGLAHDGFFGGVARNHFGYLVKYTNVGVPYVPDLCQSPPEAIGFASQPHPDSVLVLEASTAGPQYGQLVRWRWDLGNGVVRETSQAGQLIRYGFAPGQAPAPGTPVTLTVTNNLGCTHTQVLYPYGLPSASQQAKALVGRVALYPNPTTGPATLELRGLRPQGPIEVEVVNTLGQVVHQLTARPQQGMLREVLDLRQLPVGIYSLRLHAQEGMVVKRLVRE